MLERLWLEKKGDRGRRGQGILSSAVVGPLDVLLFELFFFVCLCHYGGRMAEVNTVVQRDYRRGGMDGGKEDGETEKEG